jgi:lysyl-tRNA synthetase class 2
MSRPDSLHLDAYRARLTGALARERHDRILALRAEGEQPFATAFDVTHTAADIFEAFGHLAHDALESLDDTIRAAGRVRFMRRMGKAVFLKVQDRSVRPGIKPSWEGGEIADEYLQVFVSKSAVGDAAFERVLKLDLGDIVGAVGGLMRTRTGELSVAATDVRLLTKAVRPLPKKVKGFADAERRYRQRYVDLVVDMESREVFRKRSRILSMIRSFLDERDYVEVETPMLHPTLGGAAARPFRTHHNALSLDMYLRIAPELYLKRLVVGGFERVYEINRNFRNEGLSRQHNPEFTMIEFYEAYATHEKLMSMTEELIASLAERLDVRLPDGRLGVVWDGVEIVLEAPFRRIRIHEAVARLLHVEERQLEDASWVHDRLVEHGIGVPIGSDIGAQVYALFESLCEQELIQPTFVVDFPASVSPLARRKESDPTLVDRFELFVGGREIANGFNELNDPEDQYVRFAQQLEAREAGDEEAMEMDLDYIRALEYAMPPTAGEGIGIDRLVMLLTGSASIRDVVLFPHMRPEAPDAIARADDESVDDED